MTANTKIKVLLVAPYAPRVRTLNFMKHLGGEYEFTLLTLATSVAEVEALAESRPHCAEVIHVRQPTRASIANCLGALFSGLPLQVAYCRSPKFIATFKRLLEERDFDLVHIEMIRAAYLIDSADRAVPTVFDAVDCRTTYLRQLIDFPRNLYSKLLAMEEHLKMKSYEPKISARFDRLLVITDEDAEELRALDDTLDPAVVANGVDLDYFHPDKRQGSGRDIMFIGRMGYYQNIEAVTTFCRDVLPLILARMPDVRLHIVGMDPPAQVRKLAGDNVIITGYVEDIATYIGRARATVCPINLGVGLQNKILESMALGVPVVTTSVGLSGLGAKPGSEILLADTPEDFAVGTLRLLADDKLARRLGDNGRAYCEQNHDWRRVVQDLDAVYRQALSTGDVAELTRQAP